MALKLFNSEEEAYSFLGITPPAEAPNLDWVLPENRQAIISVNKLFNIHLAHNRANGFEADYGNSRQSKYFAWHWLKREPSQPSGFEFSDTLYGYGATTTFVGARLSVGTEEEALHIAKKFGYLYMDLYIIVKAPAAESEIEASGDRQDEK